MRIPVYRAESRISTDMPGRPIRARRSVAREAEQELAKAAPAKAALAAIGEYAETRYKMETKNNLDNALLDAQEALRERREELAKSDLYGNVLDGDDPIWTRETSKLQRELSEKVGRDRYAQQQFQSGFRQLEIQNRYALRGDIDRRVEIASLQNRERKLTDVENQIANGQDLSVISMALQGVVNDTQKMAQIKAGDLSSLSKQQYAMIYNGTVRALTKFADSATSGVLAIDEMRRALRDSLPSDFYGPEKEEKPVGEEALSSSGGAYVYGLMKMLSPEDQAKMLKAVGGLQTFFEGPTIAEQKAQDLAEIYRSELSSSISVYADNLPTQTLSEETIIKLETDVASILPNIEPEKGAKMVEDLNDLKQLNSLKIGLGREATLKNIDAYVDFYAKGVQGRGGEGIDTKFEEKALKMAVDLRDAITTQLDVKGDAIAFAEANKMDTVNIEPVDLSIEAINTGQSGLEKRIEAGKKIKDLNGLNYTPILSQAEADIMIQSIEGVEASDAVAYLQRMKLFLAPMDRAFLFESLRRKGLSKEYVQAMYIDDLKIAGDLITTKDLDLEELKKGLPSIKTSGSTGVTQTLNNLPLFEDYAAAYVSGGDGAASIKLLNEQRDMAEKLAFYYVKTQDMEVGDAVEKAVESIFPGDVLVGRNENLIVPKGFKSENVSTSLQTLVKPNVLDQFDIVPLSDPRYESFQNLAVSQQALINNGKWLNNGTGDGVILHYNLEGTFIPVLIGDGTQAFELMFKDLENMDLLALMANKEKLTLKTVQENFAIGYKSRPTQYTGTGTLIVEPTQTEMPGLGDLDAKTKKQIDEAQQQYFQQ